MVYVCIKASPASTRTTCRAASVCVDVERMSLQPFSCQHSLQKYKVCMRQSADIQGSVRHLGVPDFVTKLRHAS